MVEFSGTMQALPGTLTQQLDSMEAGIKVDDSESSSTCPGAPGRPEDPVKVRGAAA